MDGLSVAYGNAQSLVSGFALTGMGSSPAITPTNWAPTQSAGGGSEPSATVTEAIERHERRLAELRRRRNRYRLVLDRLGQGVQRNADEATEAGRDSAIRAREALLACTSLLIALPKHVRADPSAAAALESAFGDTVSRVRLGVSHARRVLSAIRLRGRDAGAVVAQLDQILAEFDRALATAATPDKLFEIVERTGDKLIDLGHALNEISDARDELNVSLVVKSFEDYLIDVVKDKAVGAGIERLLQLGATNVGHGARLAGFLLDYGYLSMRYYQDWTTVESVLARMDDTLALERWFGEKVVETTQSIRTAKEDLDRLRASQDTGNAQVVLADLQRRERRDAYLQAEWFNLQTGFAAPGGPILGTDTH